MDTVADMEDPKEDLFRANRHMGEVWDEFGLFLNEIKRDYPYVSFKINDYVLEEAISTALEDIQRMADYHLIGSGPDNHKVASFFSIWVARLRPISFEIHGGETDVPPSEYPPCVFQINAYFALLVFRSFLTQPIPDELVSNLIYTFHYRDIRPETLSALAYACEQITQQRQEITTLRSELSSKQ